MSLLRRLQTLIARETISEDHEAAAVDDPRLLVECDPAVYRLSTLRALAARFDPKALSGALHLVGHR